jgi:hypothetical protein
MSLPAPLITISPDYLSGAPVFTGTRVPVQALFDYIEGGDHSMTSSRTSPTPPAGTPWRSSRWLSRY